MQGLPRAIQSGESSALREERMMKDGERENTIEGKLHTETEMAEGNLDVHGPCCVHGLYVVSDHETMAGEALARRNAWEPTVYYSLGKESFFFAGHEISIRESLDTYGALVWPGAVALCQFLENNQQQVNLMDKAVLEIGAGTGLLSIVASLLGAWVTATDLPEILSNLTFNLRRNTKGRCRYTPQVAALTWGRHLERDFPRDACQYDYVLAADVVYHHDHLDDLLATMRHFCRPGGRTALLWANKVRFQSDLRFTESFASSFNVTLLSELPQAEVRIYQATTKQ